MNALARLLSCSATALLLVGCGASGFVTLGTVSETLRPTTPPEQLVIALDAGALRVVSSSQPDLTVRAEVRVRESRYPQEVGEPLQFADHVTMSWQDGVVEIDNAHHGHADADDWQLLVTVEVPGKVAVDAKLAAGAIAIELDEARRVAVELAAGDIAVTCRAIDDQVEARAAAGQIHVELTERAPVHGIALHSSVGQVEAVLPQAVEGEFDLSATVGSVDAAARFGLVVERSGLGATAKGQVGKGEARYVLRSAVGQVRLR